MSGHTPDVPPPTFSLIFPTYNPGPRLDRTWAELVSFLDRHPETWEVLFVCDGCTDGTPSRLLQLAREGPPGIRVLVLPRNRGKSHALRVGMAAATGDWLLFTDVDLAYGFDDVVRVALALQRGSPVVVGSRGHPESRVTLPPRLHGYAWRRQWQSVLFGAVARWLLPITQSDPQAGLKGLRADVARSLLPHLRSDGFGFDCELLTACACAGLFVTEVPVCLRYEDRQSTLGLRAAVRTLLELWRIRRAWAGAPDVLASVRPPEPGRRTRRAPKLEPVPACPTDC
jgi:dolichyl-phosphate beta-glucosyltransferase